VAHFDLHLNCDGKRGIVEVKSFVDLDKLTTRTEQNGIVVYMVAIGWT
jgi:hypothetical protein